jgi:trehalose synthase
MPLKEVEVAALDPERLAPVVGQRRMQALRDAAGAAQRSLSGRAVVNVNSTAVGGGVAEMLGTLAGYARGSGIDARWLVIEGDPAFFEVTKRIHNGLYGSMGDGGRLGAAEAAVYRRTLERNAEPFGDFVRAGDVVVLHDPQTAGLVHTVRQLGAVPVWRCHVGSDRSNRWTERSWEFLRPAVEAAERCIFSTRRFAPSWLDPARLDVISPSIDPLTAKNMPLSRREVRRVLAAAGLVSGDAADAAEGVPLGNGHAGRLRFPATLVSDRPPPLDAPMVVQISRWDRMKDMAGVMQGFAAQFDPAVGAHLLLVGPAVEGVADDPEAGEVLQDCRARRAALPAAVRRCVHLAALATDDPAENAVVTNALQRHAAVVCQKSLAEGFGLTVAEAMWKSRPVIATAVGGIVDQIRGPGSGVLIDDPADIGSFSRALHALLLDPRRARRIGTNARSAARRHLLTDLHLLRYASLLASLDGHSPVPNPGCESV